MNFPLKHVLLTGALVIALCACKKDAGRHCPLIEDASGNTGPLVDLSPVSGISSIMDTLAKHPELQVFSAKFMWGVPNPGQYVAFVACNVYYKNVPILGHNYTLYARNIAGYEITASDTLPLKVNPVSLEPQISAAKAIDLARTAATYDHCPVARLGLSNFSSSYKNPDYKLVWLVMSSESVSPQVLLDANTGQVYSVLNSSIN